MVRALRLLGGVEVTPPPREKARVSPPRRTATCTAQNVASWHRAGYGTPTPPSTDTQQPTKLGAIQRRRRDTNKHDRRDGAVAPEARAQIDWVGQIRRLDLPGEVGRESC